MLSYQTPNPAVPHFHVRPHKTQPGNWTAKIKTLVCEENEGICVIDFIIEEEVMTGIDLNEPY
jgi:hypothetical protein